MNANKNDKTKPRPYPNIFKKQLVNETNYQTDKTSSKIRKSIKRKNRIETEENYKSKLGLGTLRMNKMLFVLGEV